MDKAIRPTLVATTSAALLFTVIVSATPIDVAYRAPEGHVAIETGASVIALIVAFIVFGRFLQDGQSTDVLLASALAVLGFTNLLFAAAPAAAGVSFTRWTTWAPLVGRLVAAVLFAAAAVIPLERVRRPRSLVVPLLSGLALLLLAIGVMVALLAPDLPLGIDPSTAPRDRVHISGNGVVLGVQLVIFVLYAVSSVGFLRRAERTGDRLMGWVAIAAALAAFASVNNFLFPSLYSEWIYTGDFLRLSFAVVLLVGAAREIQHYQQGLAAAAASEERRRLARELHDGLAQELAFIATQSRSLSRNPDAGPGLDHLVVAAERALDESRSAISALTRPLDEPLDAALAQAAEEVAGRVGVRLKFDLRAGIQVPPSAREALVRIVREAVSNAVRHGNASVVTIKLAGKNGVRLTIHDDGTGFDTSDGGGHGFGLTSMSERAAAIGGQLDVASSSSSGTTIEVVIA